MTSRQTGVWPYNPDDARTPDSDEVFSFPAPFYSQQQLLYPNSLPIPSDYWRVPLVDYPQHFSTIVDSQSSQFSHDGPQPS